MQRAYTQGKTMTAEEKTARIAELEALIPLYQASYYNGEAEITDAEFDLLWDELKQLAPDSPVLAKVGADDTDGFPKVAHLIPMGSQDKANEIEAFRAWTKKIAAPVYVVQYKLDGASLELQYENGTLAKALTRGDGVIGDDITPNARKMGGVVAELGEDFSGGVRGEILLLHDVWKEKYAGKANCRNAANGLMRRKDGLGCENLILIAYDASATGNDAFFQNETDKLAWLSVKGFSVTVAKEFTDVEEIIAYREAVMAMRQNLAFDIDGLVVKDRETDMPDLRRSRPERQIAFKFELESAYSVVRDVEWSENGATYTPVGIIDPVRLAGTTVKRASLANPNLIRGMGLKIGSVVSVVKRGEIIPKIMNLAPAGALAGEQEETDIVFPTTCNVCGTALLDEGTRLYCPNAACPKRLLHRLQKWIKVLDIRELGEKLVGQLFDTGRVRYITDLYTLTVEETAAFDHMGDLSAAKVIRNIHAPRTLSLATFIAGFDLEGVGELVMEKVVEAGFNTLEKLRAATEEELTVAYGLGSITAKTIADGLKETAMEMDTVLAGGVISIADPPDEAGLPLKGVSFCFTGELVTMKRSAAEEKVKLLGGSAKTTVVKGLSYLVTNDTTSGSSKNKKAQTLGVPIINEEQFLEVVNNAGNPTQEAVSEAPESFPDAPEPKNAPIQLELF
jgi:DNA ligase (NAD+)